MTPKAMLTSITKFVFSSLGLLALAPLQLSGQTCSQANVQAAVTAASAGATVNIPAGTCTWTTPVTWSGKGITLQGTGTPNNTPSTFGAGTTSTHILHNSTSGPLIQFTGVPQGQTVRISTMSIDPLTSGTILRQDYPISGVGSCNSSGCPNIRVDNIIFGQTNQWTNSGTGVGSLIALDGFFGVVDHNTLPTGTATEFVNPHQASYLGVGDFGDNSWAQPDSIGGPNQVYIENNSIANGWIVTDTEFIPTGGSEGGGRLTGRFNHINAVPGSFGSFGGHGLDTDGRPQGVRQIEVYGNTLNCVGGGTCASAAGSYRSGGTGIIFGNTITTDSLTAYNQWFDFSIFRNVFDPGNGWGYCDGESPYDTNDGVTYYDTATAGTSITASNPSGPGNLTATFSSSPGWSTNQWAPDGAPYSIIDVTGGWGAEILSNNANSITLQNPINESTWFTTGFQNGDHLRIKRATVCADQGGRGQGNLVSGNPPSPASALSQSLRPIYEMDDSVGVGSFLYNVVSLDDTARLKADRDWYAEAMNQSAQSSPTSPFNGASGTGHGTLSNRPTTCTTGVGYLATDQGSWNTSGNGFGQGILSTCVSTNTWGPYYTPYTYPHPLIGGGTPPAATPTFSPTSLSAPGRVTLSCSTPSSTIHYTVDGSTPTTSSRVYTHPLLVAQTQTLKALATAGGFTDSAVGSSAYTIAKQKTRFSLTPTSSSSSPVPYPPDLRACCGSNVASLETARGTYNLAALHNWITAATAHGSTFDYTIQGFPTWMTGQGVVMSAAPSDLHTTAACQNVLSGTTTTDCSMKEFVTKLVEDRTGLSSQPVIPVNCPHLDYLEMINEFNTDDNSGSTGWTGTYADLAVLANDISGVAHAWCSNTVVVGGSASAIVGFHSNGENAHYDVALETLLADWAGISNASLPDAISVHLYPSRQSVTEMPMPQTIVSHSSSSCTSGNTPNTSCYIAVKDEVNQLTTAATLQNAAIIAWAKNLPIYSTEGGFGEVSQLGATSVTTIGASYVAESMMAIAAQNHDSNSSINPIVNHQFYAADDPTWGCYWNCGSGTSAWLFAYNQMLSWLNAHAITGTLTSTAITGGNKWSLQLDSGAAELDFCDAWLTNCTASTSFTTQTTLGGVTSPTGGSVTLTQEPVLLSNSTVIPAPPSISVFLTN